MQFLLFSHVLCEQNYWLRQNSPVTKNLHKCFFTDSLYGWAAGDSGLIIHTSTAGTSWVIQQSGITDYRIEEIFFVNRNIGWAISNDYLFIGTNILKTSSGGTNWVNSRFPDSLLVFNNIYFFDSLTGFISGESGRIYMTTNGGSAWSPCSIDSTSCPHLLPKQDIYFIDRLTGFSSGGAFDYTGVMWKTVNGGSNWTPFCIGPDRWNVIKHPGADKIAAMGGDFEFGTSFIYSSDNGNTWSYELIPCLGFVTGFSFRTPAECWAALGPARYLTVNSDSMKPGTNWQCIPSPEDEEIYDICFTSPTLGWAFGSNGSIFKYNTAVIGISQAGNNFQPGYKLFQNYPNPFNPATKIRFSIPPSAAQYIVHVLLKVYDVLGREITELINTGINQGTYEIEWNGSEFPSGVYYFRIIAGSFTDVKKMVLLK